MLWEMILSATVADSGLTTLLPSAALHTYAAMLRRHFPRLAVGCPDIDALIGLMHHDKKNSDGRINFTLLEAVGTPRWDMYPSEDEIRSAYEIYGELMS